MIILFLCLILTSCTFETPDEQYYDALSGKALDTNLITTFYTWQSITVWIADNIEYKDDPEGYTQSPQETLDLRTGDCEDIALLFCALAFKYLGFKCNIVLVNTEERQIVAGGFINHVLVQLPDGNLLSPKEKYIVNYTIRYIYFFDDIFNKE